MKIINEKINNYEIIIFTLQTEDEFGKYFLRIYDYDVWKIFFPTEKLFSLELYKKYNLLLKMEKYDDGYCGFYLTSKDIINFYKYYIDQCNQYELKIINILQQFNVIKFSEKGNINVNKKFAIILLLEYNCKNYNININKILRHEISHHFFRTNSKYAKIVNSAINKIKNKRYKKEIYNNLLKVKQYSDVQIANEFGAHIIENRDFKKFEKLLSEDDKKIINKIIKEYNKNINSKELMAEYIE